LQPFFRPFGSSLLVLTSMSYVTIFLREVCNPFRILSLCHRERYRTSNRALISVTCYLVLSAWFRGSCSSPIIFGAFARLHPAWLRDEMLPCVPPRL
jgi:hypothetical protein